MSDKRIEALKLATQRKKEDALDKTEKAIESLIKQNRKITIRSVAREAGVSASYIYKYPELSYRIQTLREQQKYNRVKPEVPSSRSHQIIATQLRNKIKILEQEKEELTEEIKILAANVGKMSRSDNTVERLKAQNAKLLAENKELRKQLNYIETQVFEQRDFILKQGYKNKWDATSDRQKSTEPKIIQLVSDDDTLLPGILPGQSITQTNVIDDEIQQLLARGGIRLSKTTIESIASKPREQVINAINVVIENIESGVKIKSRVGLFRSVLAEEWIPNDSSEQIMLKQHKDEFAE